MGVERPSNRSRIVVVTAAQVVSFCDRVITDDYLVK